MTIKEIEELSGMVRANIRFYEAEGLVSPQRHENGYRDYSEDDLETLKKIKLLRTLHLSLDEIKCLHSGERTLMDTLNHHLARLQHEQADIEQALEICNVMRNDGAQYKSLDAQHYLDTMEQLTHEPVSVPTSDILPDIYVPWRRYFARIIDFAIYDTLWNIFLALALHINIRSRSVTGSLVDYIAVLILIFLLEPILLSLFGATAGKWILGLRVTNNEGDRMTYANALSRTKSMMFYGMGFRIPLFQWYRQWKSYKAYRDEETLDWEYHSAITLKDEKKWRIWAYIGAYAAMIGVLDLSIMAAALPKNRGDITVAEFCENYNRLASYYDIDTDSHLDENGKWVQNDSSVSVVHIGSYREPVFHFTETDGRMTGMQFSIELHGSDDWISWNQNDEVSLSILAFVGAQNENNIFSNEVENIVASITETPFKSFQYSVYGMNITCEVVYSGYINTSSGFLLPMDDTETSYSFFFSIQKQ